MKHAQQIVLAVTLGLSVLSMAMSCGGTQDVPPEDPTLAGGTQPTGGQGGTGPTMPPPNATGTLEPAPPPPPPPSIPSQPQGTVCSTWTPANPLLDADDLTTEVSGKTIIDLQQVSCRSGAQNPPPCDIATCEQWVEFLSYDSLVLYQKLETDEAIVQALRGVYTGRLCGLQGKPMARAYVALGYVLADGEGEMVKASNAFRWAFLHDWDVAMPYPDPPPTVEMTFKAAKASMGNTPIACVP